MSTSKKKRSFGTHDGSFHADEVTACALLLLFQCIDQDKIVRTRNPLLLQECEYVCDVGGEYDPQKKLFDHHQVGYQGALSSAGMVLLDLKETNIIGNKEYQLLNDTLIQGVDAHDNGKEVQPPGVCTYSHIISSFMPIKHDMAHQELDKMFFEAVHFSKSLLERILARHQYIQSCRQIVVQAMAVFKECLIFEQNIPWMDAFFEMEGEKHPALYLIMPADNHWKLRGIPPSNTQRMQVRKPLPKEWAGLLDNELKEVTGISGAIFCHKGRFISVWETKEDALKALAIALSN